MTKLFGFQTVTNKTSDMHVKAAPQKIPSNLAVWAQKQSYVHGPSCPSESSS